ncbi:MAG: signal peptide peptidase SppA [Chloroflexi bacterium]|nr:signal peptide peptidase SppA [Chloroflexota bacterium]
MRLGDIPRNTLLTIRNLWRSMRHKGLDCIVLPIQGSYPELPPQQDPLPFPLGLLPLFPPKASLVDMRRTLDIIGNDSRVQTVVLRFGTLQTGLSTLYSLRRLLFDLRDKGKRLIAWLPTAGTHEYYLASACDEIVFPQVGRLFALGLRLEATFLKDALSLAGIEANFEAIAEYKVAPDAFRRSTMSEPHQEMLDGILDSIYDGIVSAIAEGRELDETRVRELIDAMPLTATEAVETGLADAVLYEDELAAYLAPDDDATISLIPWRQAARRLRTPIKWTTRQRIGIVSLEGTIVPGRSRRVPMPVPIPLPIPIETQAGAETIVQTMRSAEIDARIAAVILHVETPGGSAIASDLIWREVRRLRERKPVVVLMGGQAASGGYYVSAPASRIVARPTTLTGSIGIYSGKFALADLYDKLGIGRQAVQRGAMAGLYSETTSFSEEERERVRRDLGTSYALFKTRVAQGREMTEEQVEDVARGRVWTGAQAREIGLVDELGDLQTAMTIAKELAGLDPEQTYSTVLIQPPRHAMPPPAFPFVEKRAQSLYTILDTIQSLAHERVWALAPWIVQIQR